MDDYETPRWLLDIAFPDGYFDPCPIGGKLKGPDGLKIVWPTDKPVFVNPPYSHPLPLVQKAATHKGPVALLLLVDPSTEWWSGYAHLFKVTLICLKLKFRRWDDTKQRNLRGEQAFKEIEMGGAKGHTIGLSTAWWWRDGTART
jgi:hypothetical protein